MPSAADDLNQAQRAVLLWVADDCPEGRFEGYAHRMSAAALRSRGLLRIRGRGPTWQAEITDAGRLRLAQLDGTNVDDPRAAGLPDRRVGARSRESADAPDVPRSARARSSTSSAMSKTSKPTKTEQLVADLVAAGGVLRVPLQYGGQGPFARQRAYAAQDAGMLPPGKRLTTTVVGGELEIRLVAGGDRDPLAVPALTEVPVAEQIARLHPVARRFRDERERHEISRVLMPRATRLVHAIAIEAKRRAWTVAVSGESSNGYGRLDWTPAKDGHVIVGVGDSVFRLRLSEAGVHLRGPWEADVARYRDLGQYGSFGGREFPTGPYDAQATGQLRLRLDDGSWQRSGRQSKWGDRQSWTLEERLPHVFREIEVRAAEAVRAAQDAQVAALRRTEQAQRDAEDRERHRQELMQRARAQLIEDRRAEELRAQADAWQEAVRLRSFCEAVEQQHGDDSGTREWLYWARQHIRTLDPLTTPPAMPELDEIEPEALAPYLPPGWSPLGPETSVRRW